MKVAKTRNAAEVVLRSVYSANTLKVKLTRFPDENDTGYEVKQSQRRFQDFCPREAEVPCTEKVNIS